MLKASIISLGCARNLVDSEVIAGSLKREGFKITDIEDDPDICVINTCAFIDSAREESVDAILEASQLKKDGRIKRLVVCGCLAQMYREKLARNIPSCDAVLGTSDFAGLPALIKDISKRKKAQAAVSRTLDYLYDESSPRLLLTPGHYAYIKISEGCSNLCSYCVISRLRGQFRSRSLNSVVEEARNLSRGGALKEINLIGQDTTLFGLDRYGKVVFPALLERLCGLSNSVRWIRILYTHPAHYTDELISTIKNEEKICRYLDLPIQHINDGILKRMNRHTTKRDIIALIEKLRKNIPGIALRTSVIVGFPGETDGDFEELLRFVRETKFERLGAFIYSKEEGTKAYRFKGHVPSKVKSRRLAELMELQQSISAGINKSFIGKCVEVLIDEEEAQSRRFVGRTQASAPEVDSIVYVEGKGLKVGELYNVRITDALEYDLIGEAV